MIKIAYIGAGSIQFGPIIVQDILLSDTLCQNGIELYLMDIELSHLDHVYKHAEYVNVRLNRNAKIIKTVDREEAISNSDFVICALEKDRNIFWSQDFHIPRKYGFKQVYGELAYVALSMKDYENLAINIAEMRRYLNQQKEIIVYYEKAAKPKEEKK